MTIVSNPWSRDWRYYQIPWDLKPSPPWDAVADGGTGAAGFPNTAPVPYPPYSSITFYAVTLWPNAPVPIQPVDPFRGWTAQKEPPTMRPAVPGLTSP